MSEPTMQGKVCVITGAASGMGRIAARELAKLGATIVMNDRERAQGIAARDDIIELSGNKNIEFVYCDMIDRSQVADFAKHIIDMHESIDVLINNAGLTNPEFFASAEGQEQHMEIMHLGHWQLTELLMQRLKDSAPSRVIQISSAAHKAGPGIDFDDMACSKIWKGRRYANTGAFQAYHRAKLAMLFATYEWAEQTPANQITFNAVSPGYFVGTDVFRHTRGFIKWVVKLVRPLLADPEKSAQTYVYLASSPEVAGISGKYWEYCKQKPSSPMSHNKALRARLINWTKAQFK
ncbi:MAG: SDR family NAD(P)-dependent oxidoreductase [Gammaproteobacteria bacterium]|nr:SDR family NAD(P)-dependent oxidoreductase [Gammaproteobacteria bacterium]